MYGSQRRLSLTNFIVRTKMNHISTQYYSRDNIWISSLQYYWLYYVDIATYGKPIKIDTLAVYSAPLRWLSHSCIWHTEDIHTENSYPIRRHPIHTCIFNSHADRPCVENVYFLLVCFSRFINILSMSNLCQIKVWKLIKSCLPQ